MDLKSGFNRIRSVFGGRTKSGATRIPLRYARMVPDYATCLMDPPPGLRIPPSMMSSAERAILYNLARRFYKGDGIIVDAGIFLGASTVCLGLGLGQNRNGDAAVARFGRPIVSFDLALANKTMLLFFKRNDLEFGLEAGDSLQPIIDDHVRDVRDLVEMRYGDIMETGGVDEPIEILFLDVLKNEAISTLCFQRYFPRLVPGAVVIQQDYLSDMLPHIKVRQESFGDYFENIGEASSSAVFRCVKPIPAQVVTDLLAPIADPDHKIALALAAVARSEDPVRKLLVALSVLRLIVAEKGLEEARAYYEALKSEYRPVIEDRSLPPRVLHAIKGADYLCASQGRRRDLIDAQIIALGHSIDDFRPAKAS